MEDAVKPQGLIEHASFLARTQRNTMKAFTKYSLSLLFSVSCALPAHSAAANDILPPDRKADWTPGVTVGVPAASHAADQSD